MANFILNENSNPNYTATICRIGKTYPIEGADNLLRTTVNSFDIVIPKDMHEGDIVVYVPVESVLSEKFLSANNLYEIGEWEHNSNAPEVLVLMKREEELRNEGKKEEADELKKTIKSMVGYFNKYGRVRIVTLRGCPSNGFITDVESLVKYNPSLKDTDWESLIGTNFSHVDDDEFCKKYIPAIIEKYEQPDRGSRFDRLIENQWHFHYDTQRLDTEKINKYLKPDNIVTIDVKVHGTSGCFSNVLINRKLSLWDKIKKFFGAEVATTEYGNIFSSHKVIKNRYVNRTDDYDRTDIWACVNHVFSPYIEKGMTIYGEIAGYYEGITKMIQKNHDYGCKVGEWKFMPYRITETDVYGNVKEWEISEVDTWTRNLVSEHPELADKIMFLNILYHGRIGDLYPDIAEDDSWGENFLRRLHDDKSFYMELKEPMCHLYESEANAAKTAYENAVANKESKKIVSSLKKEYEKWEHMRAPREGVVIRIDNDPVSEAFKVKTLAHEFGVAEQHDSGEVDIEEIS